jgi:hydroxymethylbilane synthase
MHFRIGTRSSKLALWQANDVKAKIEQAGATAELVTFETKGDKVLEVTLSKIGSKGVFTQELEDALLSNEIDLAVHSAKDMPSELPNGLELIAFCERENVQDVLISYQPDLKLENNPNLVIGTSSTRRVAFLRHFYPQIKTVDMRGNLQTRLQKLKDGHCNGILLAYAGVHRMGYNNYITQHLSVDEFVPPVGQGSVTIETADILEADKKAFLRKTLNSETTEIVLLAERSFLKTLNGGCSIPSFCNAVLKGDELLIRGGLVSLDGKTMIQDFLMVSVKEHIKSGEVLAKKILRLGGDKILLEIRNQINHV